ncbi:MAG: MBL fold metallo-hydrolase [Nevskiales bacterium]|nr:MBL fold metallo-hydrolase [Nevskiales bacterium]
MTSKHLRAIAIASAICASPAAFSADTGNAALASHRWIHGAEDCSADQDPAIETYRFDADTYVLRQNKCVNYEAPFVFVLFGADTVLVLDTGATRKAERFPLYATVQGLVEERRSGQATSPTQVLVLHTHSHGDHKAADAQFRGKPDVTLIKPNASGLKRFLSSLNASGGLLDLGGRQLQILRTPGHQAESIVLYDSRTKWLLTGDTIYPGIISVLDWDDYQSSVEALVEFASTHEVSAVIGSHIEMSDTPGVPYERGTTYQPREASLVLPAEVLKQVSAGLAETHGKRREVVTDAVVIRSIPLPARMLIRFLKAVGAG